MVATMIPTMTVMAMMITWLPLLSNALACYQVDFGCTSMYVWNASVSECVMKYCFMQCGMSSGLPGFSKGLGKKKEQTIVDMVCHGIKYCILIW